MRSAERKQHKPVVRSTSPARISEEERARRKAACDFARGSVRFEGFILSEKAEALIARYIDGELTREEMNAEVLRMASEHGDGPAR